MFNPILILLLKNTIKRLVPVFIVLLFLSQNSIAQTDSLILKTIDSIKLNARNHLVKTQNTQEAIKSCYYGISLSRKHKEKKRLSTFYSYLGVSYRKLQVYDSAVFYNRKTVDLKKELNDTTGYAISLLNLGNALMNLGDLKEAEKVLIQSIEANRSINRFKGIEGAYNSYGVVLKQMGDYPKALENYQKSLDYALEQDNKQAIGNAYNNIATCFEKLGKTNESINFCRKAIKVYSQANLKISEINSRINLAVNLNVNYPDSALAEYKIALKQAQKNNYRKQLAIIYGNMSAVYLRVEDLIPAKETALKSYKLNHALKRKKGIINSAQSLALAYLALNDIPNAEKYLNEALRESDDSYMFPDIQNVYKSFEKFYIKNNAFAKAYEYRDKYDFLKDSLVGLAVAKQIELLNIKYETLQKEKQIATQELTIEKNKQEIKLKTRTNIIISIALVFLIALSIVIFIMFSQKRKAYIKLVQKQVEEAKKETKLIDTKTANKAVAENKYTSSFLTEEEKTRLLRNIQHLLDEEIFVKNDLTVEYMAEKLSSNRSYLSQLINEEFSVHFNTFINEHRIKKARNLLLDEKYDNYSLEGIASSVGFNSRVSFNNAFKKFTGVTPSFFKKNRNISSKNDN